MPALPSKGSCFSALFGSDLQDLNPYITSLKMNGMSVAEIDVTALSSDWKSYVMGTLDMGTLEVEFAVPSSLFSNGTIPNVPGKTTANPSGIYNLAINFGDESGGVLPWHTFVVGNALLTKVSVSAEVDDAVRGSYTFRLYGNSSWTTSTP